MSCSDLILQLQPQSCLCWMYLTLCTVTRSAIDSSAFSVCLYILYTDSFGSEKLDLFNWLFADPLSVIPDSLIIFFSWSKIGCFSADAAALQKHPNGSCTDSHECSTLTLLIGKGDLFVSRTSRQIEAMSSRSHNVSALKPEPYKEISVMRKKSFQQTICTISCGISEHPSSPAELNLTLDK